jgi:dTDP-4-amino-4,6-dideoxygalactose transaminase
MAAILLDCGPGDEVILPSFTFVSTANAFVLRGAQIVFADVRPDTMNLDEAKLESLVTARTKAIVPVHYAGVACDMSAICDIATRHRVPVVEDNAHALFARYKSKYTGTFGCLATQSFHETKNMTCGEGGALVVNDPELVERALIIREKGTNRSQFFRGQVDKYTWVDVGSSYLPSDLLAAFLFAQLEAREEIQKKRSHIWESYHAGLATWVDKNGIRTPVVPAECEQAFHMYYLILPSLQYRQELIAHLKTQSILSVFHYVPLHQSEMGRKWAARETECPVTEDVSARLLRLPFYTDLTEQDQARVIDAVTAFAG